MSVTIFTQPLTQHSTCLQITNRRRRASANKKSKNKMMGGMGGMGVGGDMPLTQEMLNELNKVSNIFFYVPK